MSIITKTSVKTVFASACLAISILFPQTALAQITTIGPFPGDMLEDFESLGGGTAPLSFPLFGGAATHNHLTGSTPTFWNTNGWGLGGNGSAQAFDGTLGFGINGFATGEFIFNAPITSFGAYFGTAFTGDTMFLEFYDAGNALIGTQQSWSYTRPGDGVLEWHGYDIGQEAVRVVWGSLSGTARAPALDSIRVASTAVPPSLPTVTIMATTNGSEPSTNGLFTVSSSAAAGVGGLTINYSVDGASTATGGSDYTALSGSVTIPETQTTATISVTVIDDVDVEVTETVILNLAADSAYTLGSPSTATVNIASEDVAPPPPAPPAPTATATAAPTPVPTMSTYGLILTMLGLLLVASRPLRGSAKQK